MINICISRIEGESDYEDFGKSSKFKKGVLRGVIHYKYFNNKTDDVTMIIIKGIDFKRWNEDGNAFISFFKDNDQSISKDNGLSELMWLLDVFEKIINKIDGSLWGKINDDSKAKIFIHWGGEGRYEATSLLSKTATKLKSFPFDIITWSTQDDIKLSVEHLFNLDDSEEIIKYTKKLLKSYDAIDVKKKVIELKQKTISKWLPLAIDIQGLCEVDEKSRNDYLAELKNNYFLKLVTEHKKYINEFNNQTNRKIATDEAKLRLLIKTIKENNFNDLVEKGYLNPDEPFFFPHWLQRLSKQFDDIIAEFDE